MEEEIVRLVADTGVTTVICIVVLIIGIKYIPKWLDYVLEKSKEKDYMMDSFKTVIENNSQVIKNNSEVIKLNSETIKNYTENSEKLGNRIDELGDKIEEATKNVEILKEIEKTK